MATATAAGLFVFGLLFAVTTLSLPLLYLSFGPNLILGTEVLGLLGGLASAGLGTWTAYLISRRAWPASIVGLVSLLWLTFIAVLVVLS